jgi:putative FmdB family regulatory protein
MPIYAYLCDLCGHQQDFLQKLADPRLTTCPACSKEGLKRQLTAAGFQLKGSGWYVTDFRDGGKKPSESTSGAPAAVPSTADPKSGGESKSSDSGSAPSSTPAAAPAPSAAPASTPSSSSSSSNSPPPATSSKNSTNP